MTSNYRAADIEVLSGLEPVRRRPGMYTDTTRPNHLAHEVVDNSVDEAVSASITSTIATSSTRRRSCARRWPQTWTEGVRAAVPCRELIGVEAD